MASKMQPKGSWTLRIIILILIVVLLTSINYPKKLWDEQARLTSDCRERMENLNYVVQRYWHETGQYTADLDSLLRFIQVDSIVIRKPSFELERLSLYDAPNDSFLVGFLDQYHYDSLSANRVNEDSLILSMIPKQLFAEVVNPVGMAFFGPKGAEYYKRGRGVDDIYFVVWSRGKLERQELPFDTSKVPSKDFLLFRSVEDIGTDPITGKPFELSLNTRVNISGNLTYRVFRQPVEENSVLDNELMTNLLVNKLARTARAKLDAAMKKDTTLYTQQLQLQSDYFLVELGQLLPGGTVTIEGDREIICPVDSVDIYRDSVRIKKELFHTVHDSLIWVWTNQDKTRDVFSRISYAEKYKVTKVDTIGVTISPPFEDKYSLPPSNILDRIFSVGPIDYPGQIENNDLSWEEKR